jgi:hypothetical protein
VEHTLIAVATAPVRAPEWRRALAQLVPLWRYAVWGLALFVLLATWVEVRLDVQALRKDLDRTGRMVREQRVLADRLLLEVDARHRAVRMEQVALQMGLASTVPVVQVREP